MTDILINYFLANTCAIMNGPENITLETNINCSNLKVPELMNILQKRGITCDGYRKAEFVTLAERALSLYEEKDFMNQC